MVARHVKMDGYRQQILSEEHVQLRSEGTSCYDTTLPSDDYDSYTNGWNCHSRAKWVGTPLPSSHVHYRENKAVQCALRCQSSSIVLLPIWDYNPSGWSVIDSRCYCSSNGCPSTFNKYLAKIYDVSNSKTACVQCELEKGSQSLKLSNV